MPQCPGPPPRGTGQNSFGKCICRVFSAMMSSIHNFIYSWFFVQPCLRIGATLGRQAKLATGHNVVKVQGKFDHLAVHY
eukprot:4607407-Lingulodinium_polyedra.AAC.1